jgi:hypothetical protein
MKKYRVDTFNDAGHVKKIFWDEKEARSYAADQKRAGKIVFLLEEIHENIFDVLEEI